MNISKLRTNTLKVWVNFIMGARIQVRHIPRDEFKQLVEECTVTEWKNGEKSGEHVDNSKLNDLICQRAVTDLEGFEDDGQPFPFTAENVAFLSSKSSEFVTTVRGVCMDLERLDNLEREAEKKTSGNTSEPKSTTPALVVKPAMKQHR